jgi:hypothetical protein
MNDRFFRKNAADYLDISLRLQCEIVFDRVAKEEYIGEILAFLDACPQESVLVIKEMRITALFQFWLEAACRRNYSISVVISVRHPREVSLSFSSWGVSEEVSSALWLKYTLLAERQSRKLPRVFVDYANLMQSWRAEVSRISKALSIELRAKDEAAIDDFLTCDLYRKRITRSPVDIFGNCWISRVYAVLSEAVQDRAIDLATLNEIYRGYSESERTLRLLCSGLLNHPPVGAEECDSSQDSAGVSSISAQ